MFGSVNYTDPLLYNDNDFTDSTLFTDSLLQDFSRLAVFLFLAAQRSEAQRLLRQGLSIRLTRELCLNGPIYRNTFSPYDTAMFLISSHQILWS